MCELDRHLSATRARKPFTALVAGAWPGTTLWVDWLVHSGYRFLLADQDAEHPYISRAYWVHGLGALDAGRHAALDLRRDQLAMENSVATLRHP